MTGQVAVFEAKYSRKLDDLERDCQKVLDQIDTKMYAKKRNFKGAKTVTTRATSVTIKKLQAKKKYFFRVRMIPLKKVLQQSISTVLHMYI